MPKNNSLRSEEDENYLFGDFKLSYDAGKLNKVFILVEAKADEKLFEKFFRNNTTFFIMNGWENLLSVLTKINSKNYANVFGIMDADFRRITNKFPDIPNLFLTDFHDAQMMTIHSPGFESVLSFHHKKDKRNNFEKQNNTIIHYIHKLCQPISVLRLLNYEKNLGLIFKVLTKGKYSFIDYSAFIDNTSLSFNKEYFLKCIENKSQKPNYFKNNPTIEVEFNKLITNNYDLKELCNGHDVINVLSIALENVIGNNTSSSKISGEQLERELIIAYRLEDFKVSNLYQDILSWQTKNSIPDFIRN